MCNKHHIIITMREHIPLRHIDNSDVDIISELTNNAAIHNKKPVSSSCASGKTIKTQGDNSSDKDGDKDGESFSRCTLLWLIMNIEPFDMLFEIEDKVKGSQQELVIPSTILWYDFQ